jgi:PHD/YefM family antitoxin component YafN of YafNO toxin-antitoxin module
MKMILSEDIISVTDFARGTKEHLAEMTKHQRSRVLTQNGKAAAVVMPVAAYEAMAHEAEERRLDQELKAALDAYAKGDRGRPLDEAMTSLRKRLFSSKTAP